MNEKNEFRCPKCNNFLFRFSSSGNAIFQYRLATFHLLSVSCCGKTYDPKVVYNERENLINLGRRADAETEKPVS